MKYIELTQGQRAKVDDDLYDWLNQWKWHALWMKCSNSFYAMRTVCINEKRVAVAMHRVILGALPGQEVDHVQTGDTLNNQRENLRFCTHAQNQYNRKPSVGGSSRFKGVCWHKQHRKWVARIAPGGHRQHLGLFTDEREAAFAYDRKARELFGEFALTNF